MWDEIEDREKVRGKRRTDRWPQSFPQNSGTELAVSTRWIEQRPFTKGRAPRHKGVVPINSARAIVPSLNSIAIRARVTVDLHTHGGNMRVPTSTHTAPDLRIQGVLDLADCLSPSRTL